MFWSNYKRNPCLRPVRVCPEITHKREIVDGLVTDRVVREIPTYEYVPFTTRTLGVLLASGQPIERVSSDSLTEERFERVNNIDYVPRGTETETNEE